MIGHRQQGDRALASPPKYVFHFSVGALWLVNSLQVGSLDQETMTFLVARERAKEQSNECQSRTNVPRSNCPGQVSLEIMRLPFPVWPLTPSQVACADQLAMARTSFRRITQCMHWVWRAKAKSSPDTQRQNWPSSNKDNTNVSLGQHTHTHI